MGHVAEVIDYAPGDYPKRITDLVAPAYQRLNANPRHAVGTLRHTWNLVQHFCSSKTDIASLPLSRPIRSRGDLGALNYDRVIVGSDEIWNVRNPATGADPAYFGAGFARGHVCSFAPSFGAVSTATDLSDEVLDALKGLRCISCRDRSSKSLLDSLGLKSEILLDPTMFGQKVVTRESPHPGPIIIYGPPISDVQIDAVRSVASKLGVELISMIFPQRTEVRHIAQVDSKRFQDLIQSASAVVTGTFHGTIFSILAGKPFAAVGIGDKANKVGHLLETFGLNSRATEEPSRIIEWLNTPLATDRINEILNSETERSRAYLRNALA